MIVKSNHAEHRNSLLRLDASTTITAVVQRREAAEFLDTFSALKRCLMVQVGQAYAELGLGTTQVRFLKHLADAPRISQAELSRATETDPALTGRALQTLIERGFVRRARSADDRRVYLLELGTGGRRALKRVDAVRARLADHLVAPLDDRDRDDFKRIVRKVVAALEPRAAGSGLVAKSGSSALQRAR